MNQISGYVCLSRVKQLSCISVLQSFSPLLFTQGPPTGPERLLRKLKRKITVYECFHEWSEDTNLETDRHTNATAQNPITAKLFCTNCYLNGESEYMLPSKAFGISIRKDFFLYTSAKEPGPDAYRAKAKQRFPTRSLKLQKFRTRCMKPQQFRTQSMKHHRQMVSKTNPNTLIAVVCSAPSVSPIQIGFRHWYPTVMDAPNATTFLIQSIGAKT